jgi:hypothetical protein
MCVWNEFTKCWTWSMSLYMWIKSTYIVVSILLMQMWILFICPITSFQPFPSVESTFIYLTYHDGFGVCSFFLVVMMGWLPLQYVKGLGYFYDQVKELHRSAVTSIAVFEVFGIFPRPRERTALLTFSPQKYRMASRPANSARPPAAIFEGSSCSS